MIVRGISIIIIVTCCGQFLNGQNPVPIPEELSCDIPGYDLLPPFDCSQLPCGWVCDQIVKSVDDRTVTDRSSGLFGGAYIRVVAQGYWGAIGGKAWSAISDQSAALALSGWVKERWYSSGDTEATLQVQGKGEGTVTLICNHSQGYLHADVSLKSNMFTSACAVDGAPNGNFEGRLSSAATTSSAAAGTITIPGGGNIRVSIPQTIGTGDHPANPFDWQVNDYSCCIDEVLLNPSGVLNGRVFANASLLTLVAAANVSARYDIFWTLELDCCSDE